MPTVSLRRVLDLAGASGVQVIRWPQDRDALEKLRTAVVPRLVLVKEGSDPPMGADCLQDWMWTTGDEQEVRLRLHQLVLRGLAHGHGRPQLDSLGLLHVGIRSVPLPPKEQALVILLIERFNDAVPATELVRAAWPSVIKAPNVLASRISTLRSRLGWVGLEIRGSSAKGYTLRAKPLVLEGLVQGFER